MSPILRGVTLVAAVYPGSFLALGAGVLVDMALDGYMDPLPAALFFCAGVGGVAGALALWWVALTPAVGPETAPVWLGIQAAALSAGVMSLVVPVGVFLSGEPSGPVPWYDWVLGPGPLVGLGVVGVVHAARRVRLLREARRRVSGGHEDRGHGGRDAGRPADTRGRTEGG